MKMHNIRRWGVAGSLVGALAFGGCSHMGRGSEQTWTMNTAESIPAAVGKVKVAEEKDGNTKVKVEVEHLAQASDVKAAASTYVVWLKPDSGTAQNVGALIVDKDRKGKLETKTAFKDFRVFVTAEADANVTSPSQTTVMATKVVVPA